MRKRRVVIIRDETTNELRFYLDPVVSSQQEIERENMATELAGERVSLEEKDYNFDIYMVGKCLEFVINATRKYLIKNHNEHARFSLTTAKFQKILIFSFCRFLNNSNKECCLVGNHGEELVLSNVSCGFSINYDFSVFLLPAVKNPNEDGDNCRSLKELGFSFDDYNEFVLNEMGQLYGLNSFIVTMLPEELKKEINATVFNYILFEAKELGEILNSCKDFTKDDCTITFKELSRKLKYAI